MHRPVLTHPACHLFGGAITQVLWLGSSLGIEKDLHLMPLFGVLTRDEADPTANGRPHYSTKEGGHLYASRDGEVGAQQRSGTAGKGRLLSSKSSAFRRTSSQRQRFLSVPLAAFPAGPFGGLHVLAKRERLSLPYTAALLLRPPGVGEVSLSPELLLSSTSLGVLDEPM